MKEKLNGGTIAINYAEHLRSLERRSRLNFWASAEVFQPADAGLDRARRCIEPYLNAAFAGSSLETIEAELRYVPIVMPEDMRENYPARSKLRRKQMIYVCAPQLDYDVFVTGSFEAQLREYLRGIALSAPHLAGLGASQDQIAEFEAILAGTVERIVAERPDQTRH